MDETTLENLKEYYPKIDKFDPQLVADLFDISFIVDEIQHDIRELAQNTGMPPTHFFLLEHLALSGGAASLSELLRALNLPKQSATYMIDILEKESLVKRKPDPNDRRRFLASWVRKEDTLFGMKRFGLLRGWNCKSALVA